MKRLISILSSRECGLFWLVTIVFLGFGIFDEHFRDPYNFLDRTRHWVEIGMIAVPMTLIIATGGIDLSVGSLLALCSIVMGLAFQKLGLPLPLAIPIGIFVGALGGAFNGVAAGFFRVPPLVVTLATLAMFRGLAMGLSRADPIRGFPEGFTNWGSLETVGFGACQIPYQTLILIFVVVLGVFAFRKTRLGRWSIQIGENPTAARFSGIPINRMLFILYTLSGLICGMAAAIYTSRFATAHPGTAAGVELEVIACVIIGGTRITGGNGSVIGTFFGVLLLGTLRFGMDMQGVQQQYQIILVGMLVIFTAVLNEWLARLREIRLRSKSQTE